MLSDQAEVDSLPGRLGRSWTGLETGFNAGSVGKRSSSVEQWKERKAVSELNGSNPDSR
jgi:hypothetical protein